MVYYLVLQRGTEGWSWAVVYYLVLQRGTEGWCGVGRWYTTWFSKEALRGGVELVCCILLGLVKRH